MPITGATRSTTNKSDLIVNFTYRACCKYIYISVDRLLLPESF